MHMDASNDLWQSQKQAGVCRSVIGPLALVTLCPIAVQLVYVGMVNPLVDAQLDRLIVYVRNQTVEHPGELVREMFPIPSMEEVAFLFCFGLLQAALLLWVPGEEFTGPRAPSGHVPKYTDNGFRCLFLTLGVLYFTVPSMTFIYDHLGGILTTLNVTSFLFCIFLYFKGIHFPSTGDAGGSGNPIMDFYWGTELYPRIGPVDLKQFIICRYGMMLWNLFMISFAFKTMQLNDGQITNTQLVSSSLIFFYLVKFYWWERYYLCAADIQVDRFGFMLCWGTVCFMPLVHTLQNLFLVKHIGLSFNFSFALCLIWLGNFMTFLNYDSDTQRHRVRESNGKCMIWNEPCRVIRAKYVTLDGKTHQSILSVSGYNGFVRHFHYLPDIINLILYCIPCGFHHGPLPYLYFIYLTALLLDRTNRIDERCAKKYGKYWDQYCAQVPYKLIPHIY